MKLLRGLTLDSRRIILLVAIAAITSFVIGSYFGYMRAQEVIEDLVVNEGDELSSLQNKTITIGYIASGNEMLKNTEPLIHEIIEPDINSYVKQLGYNLTIRIKTLYAPGIGADFLNGIQTFKNIYKINLILSNAWSSHLGASLNYIHTNKLFLIDGTSTSPSLSSRVGPYSSVIRLNQPDSIIGEALSEMLSSKGIETGVFIQRGDSRADGIWNMLKFSLWSNVRYAVDMNSTSFLADAEAIAKKLCESNDPESVAVVLSASDEAPMIIREASKYPTLFNLQWFGDEGTAKSKPLTSEPNSAELGLLSIVQSPTLGTEYITLSKRYNEITGKDLNVTQGYLYDAAFIMIKSIVEAQTIDPLKLRTVAPMICNNSYGVTGWLNVDGIGDRNSIPFEIWGYEYSESGEVENVKFGYYDPVAQRCVWETGSVAGG